MVVGLTGGIGSGKTVVSDMFAKLGVTIVDADICARIVVEKGKPALAAIHEHFGDDVIDKTGELQRAVLRQIIFSQPAEKLWLESLLHPIIFEEILSQLQHATSPYAILVSPLLVETGQTALCNRILVVDAPEALQLSRTMSRDNNSSDQVNAIMASQSSRETRLAHADDVLVNDGDLQALTERVLNLHQHFLCLH
jgi:dephospho-CoA kinase